MHILRNVIHRLFQETAGNDGAAGGGAGGDNGGGEPPAQNPEVEQRAREMGWSPKEQWRGNPNSWIDAKTFVERGEHVMPILQANSRKDRAELAALRRQLQEQGVQLQTANESIQVLTNISTEQGRAAAKEKRRELLRQQAQARTDGNTDLEIDLGEQIADVTAEITAQAEAPAPKKGAKKPSGQQPSSNEPDPVAHPDYQAFVSENSWFGVDHIKTAVATAVGQQLRSDPANNHLQGKAFFDRVVAETNKALGGQQPQQRASSKVEGAGNGAGNNGSGGGGGGNGTSNGKSYADLPADAKAACDKDARRLVGEGKAFKTEADWRKYYVNIYFSS